MISVAKLSVTAVKATRLRSVDQVSLGPDGAGDNRRFFLIDERGRMVNSKLVGSLQAVLADYSAADRRLALTFPGGRVVEDVVASGETVVTQFYSRSREAQLVDGPWSEALSQHAGLPLRLVEGDGDGLGVDRGRPGAVTLISRASLQRLAAAAQTPGVDARRFRMLIEIDGIAAHEEDSWVGRRVAVGDAVVAFGGHVGRCLITSRDPDSGEIDLPTLDVLRSYRDDSATTEPIPFGIYGRVVSDGLVRVGDPVALDP